MLKVEVEITFTEPLLGSTPKNKEVYSKYIEGKKQDRIDALRDESVEVDTVPEVDESVGWTGFHTEPEHGLLIYDYVVKGFLKEAGNVLKKDLNEQNLKSKLDNYLFVFPRKIYLLRPDGAHIMQPDGVNERPLRAQTAQGPRVALAKSDYIIAGSKLKCSVELLDGHPLRQPENIIERCFTYGKYKGLGQWRNGSWGRFEAKLTFVKG